MRKISLIGVAMSALFTLLSCNDVNGNVSEDTEPILKSGDVSKQPPNNPAPVIIADDVKEWMAGQFASKSNERKVVEVSDMSPPPDIDSIAGISCTYSDGKAECFLNGKKISTEEYDSIRAATSQKTAYTGKREYLSIPGEMITADNTVLWIVRMTAEEIAELSKKYDNLSIHFPPEYQELPMPEND
jgi:hypothetical protein